MAAEPDNLTSTISVQVFPYKSQAPMLIEQPLTSKSVAPSSSTSLSSCHL